MIVKYLDEVVVNLVAVVVVFVARLLGFDLYSRVIRAGRRWFVLFRRVFRTKTILLYTDCNDELITSRALAGRLREQLRGRGLKTRVKVTRDSVDLTRWTFSRSILGIVILITDVTQLSARPRDRDRIQKRLVRYVHRGGCLVLGHDAIYTRSRNDRLQKLAGGTLDDFKTIDNPLTYTRVDTGPRSTADTTLLNALPPTITLTDNEIVTGTWHTAVDFLYCHDNDTTKPLVTHRRVDRGRVFWMNTGNTTRTGPPPSLARPDTFANVLSVLIHHTTA